MSSVSQASGIGAWHPRRPVAAIKSGTFSRWAFLIQVFLCTIPPAAILVTGRATLAGYAFWGLLGLTMLRLVLTGRRDELLCLLLATAPFINLLRVFAFYNVIIGVYGAALLYYLLTAPQIIGAWQRACPLVKWLFLYVAIYYALSFYNTRDYAVNLRLFELALTICFVLVLGRSQEYLGAALLGLIICACMVGASMLPFIHSDAVARLGLIEIEGRTLGNPTQLGVPLAFGFLALIVDKGRWVQLQSRPTIRIALLAVVLPLLALTSSRSSWLVAVAGLILCMLLGSRQRVKMLLAAGAIAVAIQGVLLSPYGSALEKGLNRTFGEKRSVRSRTSGRSDQWKVSYYVLRRSTESMIIGYGPGMSTLVYAQYSGEVGDVKYAVGKRVALHSLFMQIGVEAGLLGLAGLMLWLGLVFFRIAGCMRRAGVVLPFICLFGYVFIVVTVSGNDINSGVFLGVALLGTISTSRTGAKTQSARVRGRLQGGAGWRALLPAQ